jgi:hypothetical protein
MLNLHLTHQEMAAQRQIVVDLEVEALGVVAATECKSLEEALVIEGIT